MDDLWATKSEDVRAISFQDFQPMWSWSTNVTNWQTTCDRKTAFSTVVHRAVKTSRCSFVIWRNITTQTWAQVRVYRTDRRFVLPSVYGQRSCLSSCWSDRLQVEPSTCWRHVCLVDTSLQEQTENLLFGRCYEILWHFPDLTITFLPSVQRSLQ